MHPRTTSTGDSFLPAATLPRSLTTWTLSAGSRARALAPGVDVRIVSERLGHSSPMITWQTYQHVIQGMQADAAERVADLIFGA